MRISVTIAIVLCAMFAGIVQAQPKTQPPPLPMHELKYFVGSPQMLGDGHIYTWVRIDTRNRPVALGVTFSESALNNLPNLDSEYLLRFPEVVTVTPYNHFAIDWQPMGHFPMQFYGVPHFDFHFYMISPQDRGLITGYGADVARLNRLPAANYIPAGYVPAYPAVALMGLHWVRMDFPEFHGQPFTQSLLYGSYNGRFTFIEPMITRAFLLAHPATVKRQMYQSKTVAMSGYYPTWYTVTYDGTRHLYTVALEGLVYRQAK